MLPINRQSGKTGKWTHPYLWFLGVDELDVTNVEEEEVLQLEDLIPIKFNKKS